MSRRDYIDVVALVTIGIGVLCFWLVPLLANRAAWGVLEYFWSRERFIGLIGWFVVMFAFIGSAVIAFLRLRKIDLPQLARQRRFLAPVLKVLRLDNQDYSVALVRLGLLSGGMYFLGMLLISISAGSLLEPSYGMQLVFIGVPLMGASVFRLVGFQNKLSNMLAGRSYYLEILSGTLIGGQPRLSKTKNLKIGKNEDNDIVLFDDDYVLGQGHVALYLEDGQVILYVHSNIYINNQPMSPGKYLISPGTVFQVGRSSFQLKLES